MNGMKRSLIIFTTVFCIGVWGTQPAFSEMKNYDLEQRIKELEKKLGTEKEAEEPGAIELDYSYADDKDISSNAFNDSTSDLDIGTIELGLESAFHEYVTGNFVLKGEALDSDNDRVFWDEATITVQKEGFPVYFVGGKRGQPFGMFESHLINDPITQDCYEIAKTGATVGFTPNVLGLDISATIYKGEELIGHLAESEYGFERDNTLGYEETDKVDSYIANITAEPVNGVVLSIYYDSEPGDDDRNETIGGTVHWEISRLTLDAEYIGAINREKNFSDNEEYKEFAWFASVAFQAMDPLEIAVRYENFDDGMDSDQDEHLDNRYGLGFTYTLFEKDSFACNLLGEYRISNFEAESGNPNGVDDKLNEFFLRLAIEF